MHQVNALERHSLADILACPACSGALTRSDETLSCTFCGEEYEKARRKRQWDLRLRGEKSFSTLYRPAPPPRATDRPFAPAIPPATDAAIAHWPDLALAPDVAYGNRLTPELVSYFPTADHAGQWMLDLGCGERQFEPLCTSLTGFNYVGIDYDGRGPDILADAHALPFGDASFDFILSIAVLEHLAYPDLAMKEAFRVLKPGGTFVGTVAFLEPFHMDSYFHMTHLGNHRVLANAGFEVMAIAPNREWTGVRAQAEMSLFPGLPNAARRAVVSPVAAVDRLLRAAKRIAKRSGSAAGDEGLFRNTGGFRFVARRPRG